MDNVHKELEDILDAVPAMVFYKDRNNRFIRVNKMMADETGKTKTQIEGKTAFELYPELAEKYWKDDKEVMDSGKPKRNIIETLQTPKGARLLHTDKIPYVDEKGGTIGIIGFSIDITERKAMETELRLANEEWDRTFNAISDGIFLQKPDNTIIKANRAFAKFLNVKPEDLIGKKCFEVTHHSDKPWPCCPLLITIAEKVAHTVEINDPKIGVPLLVTTSPVFNDAGELIAIVHISKDISSQKKVEGELLKKIASLEKFQNITVDRELKMKELKTRIAELEAKLESIAYGKKEAT